MRALACGIRGKLTKHNVAHSLYGEKEDNYGTDGTTN